MKTVVLLLGPPSAGKSTNCGVLQNVRNPKLPFRHFGSLYDISHHELMKAQPSVKSEIKHDAIIDTSVGSPDDLAKKVIAVTEAEKPKERP